MLEGSLGDFSLPDIFQLIALTKKSGSLTVRAEGREGRVLFRGGEVCFAVADVERVALGARLVASGLVDEEQITRVLERKQQEGGDVIALLLDEAVLDEDAVDTFLRNQIEDAVFELMRLEGASFSFDSTEPEGAVGLTVATEHLIMEGSQRLSEWASIRGRIPTIDAVLTLSPEPGAPDRELALSKDDWRVLALIDGHRTVRDIVELTGQGEYATAKLLADLVERGFVLVSEPGEDGNAVAGMVARREMLRRLEELELGKAVSRPEPSPAQPSSAQPSSPEPSALELPRSRSSAPLVAEEPEEAAAPTMPAAPTPQSPPTVAAAEQQTAEQQTAEQATAEQPAAEAPAVEEQPAPAGEPRAGVDRFQVARELASLGFDDAPKPPAADAGEQAEADTSAADETAPSAAGSAPSANDGPAPSAAGSAPRATDPASSANGAAPTQDQPATPNGSGQVDAEQRVRHLTRDEDVNKGLLLRLIDGVKGA